MGSGDTSEDWVEGPDEEMKTQRPGARNRCECDA